MKLSEIITYLYKHKCSCLIVKLSLNEYEAMNTLLLEERYSTFQLPTPGTTIQISGPYMNHKFMFVIDESINGVELIEFNTIRPEDYMNFQGSK